MLVLLTSVSQCHWLSNLLDLVASPNIVTHSDSVIGLRLIWLTWDSQTQTLDLVNSIQCIREYWVDSLDLILLTTLLTTDFNHAHSLHMSTPWSILERVRDTGQWLVTECLRWTEITDWPIQIRWSGDFSVNITPGEWGSDALGDQSSRQSPSDLISWITKWVSRSPDSVP